MYQWPFLGNRLKSEHGIHRDDHIGNDDLKCHILVKWNIMVNKVLMIK